MSKCKMCDTSRYTKVEVAPGRYRLKLLDDTIDISCNLDLVNQILIERRAST